MIDFANCTPQEAIDWAREEMADEDRFQGWHGGGGCMAERIEVGGFGVEEGDRYVLLTDEDGSDVPARQDGHGMMVGYYDWARSEEGEWLICVPAYGPAQVLLWDGVRPGSGEVRSLLTPEQQEAVKGLRDDVDGWHFDRAILKTPGVLFTIMVPVVATFTEDDGLDIVGPVGGTMHVELGAHGEVLDVWCGDWDALPVA